MIRVPRSIPLVIPTEPDISEIVMGAFILRRVDLFATNMAA